MKPKITLNGDDSIKITIGSEYSDEGATAKVMDKDKTKDIEVSGKVNTKKVGIYTVTYSVKNMFLESKVERTVSVVEKGPVITLEGDKELTICPNKDYEEVGYKAVSGDDELTDSVKYEVKDDSVKYLVKDKNNISFAVTRKLIKEDKETPKMTVNGNSTMYVTVNTSFTDPGVTVEDNCYDGLTEKVETTGSVDVSKLGEYEINYKVVDGSNNEATATRKVVVQKEYIKRGASLSCGKAGVIYLTFDDGPSNATTPKILDILKEYNVKATFFVTSANGGSDALIKREYDEGHLVALHTAVHEYNQVYASDEAFFNDLQKISDRVERITGQKSYIQRFPGGSSNTVSRHYSSGIMTRLTTDIEARGYNYVDWNVDSRDAEGKNADQIVQYTTAGLSKNNGNVVLMHDIKYTTLNALERVIQYGQSHGYTFDVLDKSVKCHHKVNN